MELKCKIAFFLLFFMTMSARSQDCVQQQLSLARSGACTKLHYQCADLCTGLPIVGEENCLRAGHCCYDNNTCFFKINETAASPDLSLESNITKQFLGSVDPKFLNLGGGGLILSEFQLLFPKIPICLKFPDNCQINFNSSKSIQPPVDVPYCQRIACRSDNPFLELDPFQCLGYPGCGFDFELFYHRQFLSQAVIPGVPVCHSAVRNEVFLKKANDYIRESGRPWSPLLADCLIDENREEIFAETKECAKLKVLQELGYFAKLAGWRGITSEECHLINCCWLDNNCFYPLSSGSIKTRSRNHLPHLDYIIHGRPQCRPFPDNLASGDFLDAYDTCLKSGCYTDVDEDTLLQHLVAFAALHSPSTLIERRFLDLAHTGFARADNYKDVMQQLIVEDRYFSLYTTKPIDVDVEARSSADNNQHDLLNGSETDELNLPLLGDKELTAKIYNITSKSRFLKFGLVEAFHSLCPYEYVQWPNLPRLLGRLDGCCEVSRCYHPRTALSAARSEIASYRTSWASWSACSSSCGSGTQTRRRFCIGDPCEEIPAQSRSCNPQPCPTVIPTQRSEIKRIMEFSWSPYSDCSVSCGGGVKTRRRKCPNGERCDGGPIQTVPCRTGQCPGVRKGQWSRCSKTCGIGTQTRPLICERPGDYGCPKKLIEKRKCERFCGHFRFQDSACDQTTCVVTRMTQCVIGDGRPGYCRPSKRPKSATVRKCFDKDCFCFHNRHHRGCRHGNRL